MLPKIVWPFSVTRKSHASPFERGDTSPLGFILHVSTECGEETAAVAALRELAPLDEIDAADTGSSLLPRLTIARQLQGSGLLHYFLLRSSVPRAGARAASMTPLVGAG